MEAAKIKEKLSSTKYDFLRTKEGLKDNIILLTTGGSHAYGTDTPTSDLDIRGITLNTREELLTMQCRDKPYEDRETDTVVYTMQQIRKLLTNANPNVLEILGTREDHLFIFTEQGKLLRENADLFLSKRAINSFGGYATAQLRRLQNALARDNYPQKEKEQHILNSITNMITSFEDRYQGFTKGSIRLYIEKSDKADFEQEIYMDADFSHIPLRDFKGMYSDMSNVIKDYESLNHRNNKKDDLHLNKHAMHLIRLLATGTEILEGKGVNTYREKDRDFLLQIRNGELVTQKDGKNDYSTIFEIVDEYEKKFQYAVANTELPDRPDEKKIDELVAQLNWSVLR